MSQDQQRNPQYAHPNPTGAGFQAQPQAAFTQTQMQPQAQMQMQPQAQSMPYFSAQNYQVPGFVQQQQQQQQAGQVPGILPLEQSFIENILRLNRGKIATFYMTFENNSEWNAKIFKGRVEEAGRDHIIVGDIGTGMYYLLLMVNLDYVTFDEPIEYQYPFGTQAPLTQYSPR